MISSLNKSWAPIGWIAAVAVVLAVGCSSPQPIRHYEPEVVAQQVQSVTQPPSDVILAVEDFSAGTAYDEQRIVYRADQYKFDYYHFHRWAAPTGQLVSDTLREVYRQTGAFKTVVGGYATQADVVLSGRVISLEEVDQSKKRWFGRVVVNIRLRDAKTGELLWNDTMRVKQSMTDQSPDGLAAAISKALTKIGVDTTPKIVQYGKKSVRHRTTQPAGGSSPFKQELEKQRNLENQN